MTKTPWSVLLVFLFGLFFVSSTVSAQVAIEMSSSTGGATHMYVKNGMIRVNSQTQGGEVSNIFRDDEMLMLNHQSRSYYRFGREEIQAMVDRNSEARRDVETQLANLPPDQRAMVDRMMGDRLAMLGSALEPLRAEAGGSAQVGNYACTEYTVYRGDERRFEICSAPVGDLGPAAQEAREAFEGMAQFSEAMMEALSRVPIARMIENPYLAMSEIDGFPVRTRTFDANGQVATEVTLTSITKQNVDDALFSPPDGYKEEDISI